MPNDKIEHAMRPIADAVPGSVAALLRNAPLSPGKVDFAWKSAVGAALQRATAVRLEGKVLLVDATSKQWAREVMRGSALILPRLQALLGPDTVTAIRVRD